MISAVATAAFLVAMPATAQSLRAGILNVPPLGGPTAGGYCFDLLTEIGSRANLTFEYQPMPLAEQVPALTSKAVDVMCSLHSASNNWRSIGIAFTSAIINNPGALVVRASDQALPPYTGLADLSGQPVGTVAGAAIFERLITEAGATPVLYPSGDAVYAALVAGEIKAWFTSGPTLSYRQKILGNWPQAVRVETFVNPAAIPQYVAIGVRNQETELLGSLQAALEGIKADGTLAKLLDAWALPPPVF